MDGATLVNWTTQQRWYPGAVGTTPEPWAEFVIEPAPEAMQEHGPRWLRRHQEMADAGNHPVVVELLRLGGTMLQVPVLANPKDSFGSTSPVPDATKHPAGWRAYLAAMGVTATDDDFIDAHVLGQEQSNTSVVFPNLRPAGAPDGVILKVFRTLTPGRQPDAVIPVALAAAGFDGVPPVLDALTVEIPGFGVTDLAILSALVPYAKDGFELTTQLARHDDGDLSLFEDLGTTTARLHQGLIDAYPTTKQLDPDAIAANLATRAGEALGEVPELAPLESRISEVITGLRKHLAAADEPRKLQQIHGDLHLGQTLFRPSVEDFSQSDSSRANAAPAGSVPAAAGQWYVLDFEGEPLRDMADRNVPDLPERDVAGMLRSFAYAEALGARGADAESKAVEGTSEQAGEWANKAADAFMAGYLRHRPIDLAVLHAYLLDKALYEVVYETRNRPNWVGIPLAAVERLTASQLPRQNTEKREKVGPMSTASPKQPKPAKSTAPAAKAAAEKTATPPASKATKSNSPKAAPVATPALPVVEKVAEPVVPVNPVVPVAAPTAKVAESVASVAPAKVAEPAAPAKPVAAPPTPAAVPAPVVPTTTTAKATPPVPTQEAKATPSSSEKIAAVAAAPVATAAKVAPKVPKMSNEPPARVAPPTAPEIDLSAYYSIPEGTAWNPHSVLGGHPFKAKNGSDWAVIRVYRPLADEVTIITPDGEFEAPHKAAGVFETVVPAEGGRVPAYRVRTRYGTDVTTVADPYGFLPSLGQIDTHLIHEGRHEELWEALGANYHKYTDELGDVEGTSFA
ncbi:MAG: hypothetical protein FWG25_06470, partial [Promicromonosporaceae bacterium]|nr:hypothetical protein [Promicromonosporaceae bacterium]